MKMRFFVVILLVCFTGLVFASELGSFTPFTEIKTKPVPLPKIKSKGATVTRRILAEVTFYSPPLFPRGKKTASFASTGLRVGEGIDIVAVDPKETFYGSIVWFPGHFQNRKFVAGDSGKDIKGARKMDLWVSSYGEAKEGGRQFLIAVVESAKRSP